MSGANGGGGRIAVWYGVTDANRSRVLAGNLKRCVITTNYINFTGIACATNGPVGYAGKLAQPGTVVFLTVTPPGGSVILLR